MPTLLTFGDSNTYGMLPIEYEGQRRRLGPDARWPGVALAGLGADWELVEEGLPGRTTRHPDPEMGPHMDGRVGLFMALESHGPIDMMTLMLGTNDLKTMFNVSPDKIATDIGTLLDIALSEEMQERHDVFDILLICPPPVLEQGLIVDKFIGAHEKSLHLPRLLAEVADARDVDFLDAGQVIESSQIDGVHFDADTHLKLGGSICNYLKIMSNPSV